MGDEAEVKALVGQPPYLRVSDLTVRFGTSDGAIRAVDQVSFSVWRGRSLGIVGESGSGKSALGLALLGLHDPRQSEITGRIEVAGGAVLDPAGAQLRRLRGREIAMVFQDPLAALHPYYPVGWQVAEAYRVHHRGVGRRAAHRRAVEMLGRVGIPQPARRAGQYPHEFSGGMRQRVMIAMALVNDPALLIADEPTTALDTTVQAQVLDLLAELRSEFDSGIVLISHDFGVIGRLADEVLVMYAGRVVEQGSTAQVLGRPEHPYTRGLLASVPSMTDRERAAPELVGPGRAGPAPVPLQGAGAGEVLLSVTGLRRDFAVRAGGWRRSAAMRAVDGLDFEVRAGETFGLVGESGSGKTTTGRLLVRLLEPTAGRIVFDGQDVTHLGRRALRPLRRDLQIIFQDPYASLNPRQTVEQIVGMPLRVNRISPPGGIPARVRELLELVGLGPEHRHRYPHEFSGGQRQRIGIARALALRPRLIVADEPVSALDVSIQAQVVELLRDLRRELGLTLVLISHDLAVVRDLCQRVAVMYLGKIVEIGDRDDVYRRPQHPYTQTLLAAVLELPGFGAGGRRLERPVVTRATRLVGDVPGPLEPPSGCRFRTRCPKAQEICAVAEPPLTRPIGASQLAACHFPAAGAVSVPGPVPAPEPGPGPVFVPEPGPFPASGRGARR